jgi:uncharacterized membrane protein YoaK (UPF0700 family)
MPFMLLFVAGIVDAIGFIHLKNGLFVSFMSGNTTHVAMLLSSHQYHQSLPYIGVILLFVTGIITINKAMPLTFATAFLANTGRELAMLLLGQGDKKVFIKQISLWLSIFIGAIVGSELMVVSLSYALVVPIILCLCIAGLLFWLKELTNDD